MLRRDEEDGVRALFRNRDISQNKRLRVDIAVDIMGKKFAELPDIHGRGSEDAFVRVESGALVVVVVREHVGSELYGIAIEVCGRRVTDRGLRSAEMKRVDAIDR